MPNKNTLVSMSKRFFALFILTTLMIFAFSQPKIAKLQSKSTEVHNIDSNKLISQIPAQKIYNTVTLENTVLAATNVGLLSYNGEQWLNLITEETFVIKTTLDKRLIASTRQGILISNDSGKNWYKSNQGLVDGLVALSIELTNQDQRIYIGTDRHGVFRSDDGGNSWTKASVGLPASIGINPFAVIKRLAIDPNNSDLVFASSDSDGIYFSQNGGRLWQKAKLQLPGVFSHRVNPPFISFDKTSNTIYALVTFPVHSHLLENSIHKSADNGQTWELVGKITPNEDIYDFSVNNTIANVKIGKVLKNIDLIKLADEERRKLLTEQVVSPNAAIIPGTEADFEKDDIAVLHDDGKFANIFTANLTGTGQEVAKRFYQRHADEYDILINFVDPSYGFSFTGDAGAIAYNLSVQNQIGGIGRAAGITNGGPTAYGSKGKLLAFCNLGNLNQYSTDVNQSVFITNSTLDVLSHEVAHTWGAYFNFDDNGVTSNELLGRQLSHWNFFFNSNASELEGNAYQDLGNGKFKVTGATSRYNDFDLYAMGLTSGASSSYIISKPTNIDPQLTVGGSPIDITQIDARGLPPLAPPDFDTLTVTGTRKNVSLADITKIEGPRIPTKDPQTLRIGFVLISPLGKEPDPETLDKLSTIRKAWLRQFAMLTNGGRIIDATAPARGGSDMKPPKIKVKGPNGGDVVPAGSIITISWDSSDENGIAKHDIFLSLDGGITYPVSVASLLNGSTQSFDYTLPVDLFSSSAKIKVVAVDYAGNKAESTSDISFKIERETVPPTVKVEKPNGGEQVIAGSPYLITWTSSDNGMLQSHDVNVSLDGGKSFRPIFTGLPGTTQSFLWQVPDTIFSSDARIQVIAKDASGNIASDVSDKSFSIVTKDTTVPQVKLLSPIGGESLQANGQFNITWTSSDNTQVARHELQLSTNSGATFDTIIATGLSGSTQNFIWQVPNVEITTARIKIIAIDNQNNSSQDASSKDVTITKRDVTAPTVKVMTPNGGETLRAGENISISWQSTDNVAIQSQRISLSLDSGNTFSIQIASALPANANSFTFKLPDTIQTTKARVKVEATDTSNLIGSDISDADFTISGKDTTPPQVTVVSPNGNEVLANSDMIKISWRSSDNVSVVSQDIQISLDAGANYTTLQSGLAGNVQEMLLDLHTFQSEKAKIKIIARDAQNNIGSDESDNTFVLLVKPSITNVKYNSSSSKLLIFATGISANSTVEINGQTVNVSRKFNAQQNLLRLSGSLNQLNLRIGDNIILVKERGLVSGAFKLNISR